MAQKNKKPILFLGAIAIPILISLLLPLVLGAQDCTTLTKIGNCTFAPATNCGNYCSNMGGSSYYPCFNSSGSCFASGETCTGNLCGGDCTTDNDCVTKYGSTDPAGECQQWTCNASNACVKTNKTDGVTCPTPPNIQGTRDAFCRDYVCQSGSCIFNSEPNTNGCPPPANIDGTKDAECREYLCDGYGNCSDGYQGINQGEPQNSCSGLAPQECQQEVCGGGTQLDIATEGTAGNCDGTRLLPRLTPHPSCENPFYVESDTVCKKNLCIGEPPELPDLAGFPPGTGFVQGYCGAFPKDYQGQGYKDVQCLGGVSSLQNAKQGKLWADIETRSLSDAGPACCAKPVCPVSDAEGNDMTRDALGNLVRRDTGIIDFGTTISLYKCMQSHRSGPRTVLCDEGWTPLQYAEERCTNSSQTGYCCKRSITKGCGNGIKETERGEQCERGIGCTENPLFPNCGNDCKCYANGQIPIGGGTDVPPVFLGCSGTSCVLQTINLANPGPQASMCTSDVQCQIPPTKHLACAGQTCSQVDGAGPNTCTGDADCWIIPNIEPVADATVGEITATRLGCPNAFFPSSIDTGPGSVVLRSDRDGVDADCKPSFDPLSCANGETISCPNNETFDYGTWANNPNCCLQYAWQCISEDCPTALSNTYPSNPKRTLDKNPTFAVGETDVGKTFLFELIVTNGAGQQSNSSFVAVNVLKSGLTIELAVIPIPLLKGTRFTTAEAFVNLLGSLSQPAEQKQKIARFDAPAQAYVVASIVKRADNKVYKTVRIPNESTLGLPNTFDFKGTEGNEKLEEQNLPLGNYTLKADVYDAADAKIGTKTVNFNVEERINVPVPETQWAIIPILLVIVLFVLSRQGQEKTHN